MCSQPGCGEAPGQFSGRAPFFCAPQTRKLPAAFNGDSGMIDAVGYARR